MLGTFGDGLESVLWGVPKFDPDFWVWTLDPDPDVDPSPFPMFSLGAVLVGVFSSFILPLGFTGAGGDISNVFEVGIASFFGLNFSSSYGSG